MNDTITRKSVINLQAGVSGDRRVQGGVRRRDPRGYGRRVRQRARAGTRGGNAARSSSGRRCETVTGRR